MSASRTACLVVAAGSGVRLGAGRPKAFVEVAGRSLLDRCVDAVTASGAADVLVLVVPAALVDPVRAAHDGALVVAGGSSRQQSVAAGLSALGDDVDVVLVHDAARAFAPPSTFVDVAGAVRAGHRAVVPAVLLHDTVRAVRPGVGAAGSGGAGGADGAGGGLPAGGSTLVDRSTLRAVQTPQGFDRAVLDEAHRLLPTAAAATDDATLVERLGHEVHLVQGSSESFKVTGPLDLLLATVLAARDGSR